MLHWVLNINLGIPTKDDDKPTIFIHRRYCSRPGGVEMGEGCATPTTSPGPTNLPLIGSVLSIPQNQQGWVTFTQWKEQFGQ